MGDTITLRAMGPDDLGALMAVAPGLFDNPLRESEARAFLNDPANLMILAFDGISAVGMATGTILRHPDKAPALFVNEVGVRESHQRRGIGRQVTEALIAEGRARGCEGAWLGTEADNKAALALYRSMAGEEVAGAFFGWDGGL